ncbi:MAG: hypothetical protein SFV15_21900 [Polyangiaceae bacterium]|nr:hypothetical protein [Polyangiaceae bacterium]
MNTKEQVLEMLSAGRITSAESEELLLALNEPPRSWWRRILNPFEGLNAVQALAWGVLGALGGIALSRWNVRFDGALDLHPIANAVSISDALADQVVAWPLTAAVFWGAANILARQLRFVDFLGYVGVARLPYLIPAAVAASMKDQLSVAPEKLIASPPPGLLLLSLVTVPVVVWMVTWLWQGFRTASGLRGAKSGFLFVGALVFAEVLSKLALGVFSFVRF